MKKVMTLLTVLMLVFVLAFPVVADAGNLSPPNPEQGIVMISVSQSAAVAFHWDAETSVALHYFLLPEIGLEFPLYAIILSSNGNIPMTTRTASTGKYSKQEREAIGVYFARCVVKSTFVSKQVFMISTGSLFRQG